MGVVYEVHDRQRGARVALKHLRRADPAWLYQFKQEFRALADVSHPNLVALHELVAAGDQWFFTMELIGGVDLLRYVRFGPRAERSDGAEALAETIAPAPDTPPYPSTPSGPGSSSDTTPAIGQPATSPEQLARLRATLAQLAVGVDALHRAGKLHRDLKPSNVLVTPEGRVVILDFGLVTEATAGDGEPRELVGTPAYMSPEQGASRAVSTATDWYSVGVILYEALTGRVPFAGKSIEMLSAKQQSDAPPPLSVAPDAPHDLARLCVDLLRRGPADRPAGTAVLRALDVAPEADAVRLVPVEPAGDAPLVGRDSHLAALRDALAGARRGEPLIATVSGLSGMGKSSLVRRFLDDVERDDVPPLVLAGRCYERESVPYKAVDAVVDALSHALRRMPRRDVDPLVTDDVAALGRLFPVLWRVESLAARRDRHGGAAQDPHELRRRAFAGLRSLLSRLAERRTIVVFVDDVQWGDVDSAALLAELMRAPGAPPLLVVGSYRSDEADSPLVAALVDSPLHRAIEVGPLSADEAEQLAVALLPEQARLLKGAAEIARESDGNPYFVAELARHLETAAATGANAATGSVSLDTMLYERIAALPDKPRRLLEMVAVAGRPLGQAVFARAADVTDDAPQVIAMLRSAMLIRTHGVRDRDGMSTYHDRIRETVVQRLTPDELAARHRALALELEASGDADAETLAEHYLAAGETAVASRYAARAAEQAAAALAFDRAARLYAMTLELGNHDRDARRRLMIALADALASGGRGADASEAYLAAIDEGAGAAEALDLKRRAAEQYLVSGYIERGLATVREVLAEVHMKLPRTRRGAITALLARRVQLKLRRRSFTERDVSQISAETLGRIDVCWSTAAGLMLIDNLQAMVFQTRHLQLALAAGEPYRVARGLALEAGFLTTISESGRRKAVRVLDQAEEIATRIGHPHALGLVELIRGIGPSYAGRWSEALAHWNAATDMFRNHCVGVHFEKINVEVWTSIPLFYLGELAELQRLVIELCELGRTRRNHFYEMGARTGYANMRWLAADDPAGAQEALDYAVELWFEEGVHLLHYHAIAQQAVHLYTGDGPRAFAEMEAAYPKIASSGMLRLQRVRVEATCMRARAALARAAAGESVSESLAIAEREIRKLEKEHMPWSSSLARLLRASLSSLRGDDTGCVGWLRAAEAHFRDGEMMLYAAVARRRQGLCLGGEKGAALIVEADRFMRKQDIANPEKMTDALAPGFR
jgi:hypothetical protein